MFNIMILDVAIGMIFIYLLLSIMCTAANEIIELLLKKRAIDLERGIRELLVPGSPSGSSDIVQKLYDHPLINSLFGGSYQDTRIATRLRWVARTHLPSYIPARNFSLALMDLILPGFTPDGGAGGPSGAANAMEPSPAPVNPPPEVVNVAGGTAAIVVPPAAPAAPVPNPSLAALRAALLTNEGIPDRIKQGVVPLLDAAGNDVAKARENIESWFNSSMDRVSSWYKRRAQVTIMILGLFVAIVVNVDTITVVRRLSTDKALRETLVAAAEEYSKANAFPSPANSPKPAEPRPSRPNDATVKTPSPAPGSTTTEAQTTSPVMIPTPCPTPTPLPSAETAKVCVDAASAECAKPIPVCENDKDAAACKSIVIGLLEDCVTDPKSEACKYGRVLATIPACRDDKSSPECKQEALIATTPACTCDQNSAKCKYEVNERQLESLGLPIGWTSVEDPKHKWPGSRVTGGGGWGEQIKWHWLGWLLTALAISLGAPFWFDLLNKFIVVRSAVKPHEKSPEEGSKD